MCLRALREESRAWETMAVLVFLPMLPPARADTATLSKKSPVGKEGREVNNPFAEFPRRKGWNKLAELKGPIWETT